MTVVVTNYFLSTDISHGSKFENEYWYKITLIIANCGLIFCGCNISKKLLHGVIVSKIVFCCKK